MASKTVNVDIQHCILSQTLTSLLTAHVSEEAPGVGKFVVVEVASCCVVDVKFQQQQQHVRVERDADRRRDTHLAASSRGTLTSRRLGPYLPVFQLLGHLQVTVTP